ncbi:hypothetical protein [Luteolibacter sp.]|uniref:hypothetical protein n=2 Tax=Luteolibacter sp. TaxID=1962973 RepID=UPI0032636767
MRKFLLSMAGVFAIASITGFAAEPTQDLLPKEAVRLIAMRSDVQENTIEISFIVDGSAKCGEGFEVKHVRRVAAILPVRDGSLLRRKLVFYDLFWNESLGWFMWESRQERTGEAVYLWSELKGEIVNG